MVPVFVFPFAVRHEDTIEVDQHMSWRALDFKDHRRELDQNRYVYAVVSRRARGLSIGVNLNTDKLCNFDCPYCQVDRRTPGGPSAIDVAVLVGELERLLDRVASGVSRRSRRSTASPRRCGGWPMSRSATASPRRHPSPRGGARSERGPWTGAAPASRCA